MPTANLASTCAPSTTPAATADTSLDGVFSNQLGPGWLGGDMAYSTKLPNGQEAFDFNDTLLGTAQANGQVNLPLKGFIRNSQLVGDLSTLSTDFAGTSAAPSTLIPDSNTAGGFTYLWELGATDVENGQQLVFVNEYRIQPGALTFSGRSAIAVFSLPTSGLPQFQSLIDDSTVPTTQWGNAMTHDGTYTYVYGIDENHVTNAGWMEVARVPLNDTATVGDWQYWNGTTWVSGEANAVVTANRNLFTGVTAQQGGTGYESVQTAGGGSAPTTLDVSYACSPQGPWSGQTPVYTVPEIAQYAPNEIAYTPNFHPDISGTGGLVISYSVDTTASLSALEQDVHEYQPRFVQLNYDQTVTSIPVTRIYGTDAIGTSIAVSQARFPAGGSAKAVVLARSDFFSDALAGGPLAAERGGPLLITPGASEDFNIDPRVESEIRRVLPAGDTVYILGGNLALSPSIDSALQDVGYKTQRIAGANEYSTAVDIADQIGDPSTLFEATGLDFADALSAGPAAILTRGAILLTDGTTQAPETAGYLAAHPHDTRYAIGGPLAAAGADPTATAVYGQDLYDTSAAVARTFFPDASAFGAATGVTFPDALSGGVFMGELATVGPMLLVEPSGPLPTSITGYTSNASPTLSHGYLFGGPLAVGDDVLRELESP